MWPGPEAFQELRMVDDNNPHCDLPFRFQEWAHEIGSLRYWYMTALQLVVHPNYGVMNMQ